MNDIIKKYSLHIAGALTGAAFGFLYWKFVGCASGNCAITSSPINSTLYGALMFGLIFSMFKKDSEQQKENIK